MELFRLKPPLIRPGDSIVQKFAEALSYSKAHLKQGDVVAVASKVVAIAEGRLKTLSQVRPTSRAIRIAEQFSLDPDFAQVVIDESDQIYGGVGGALLTLRNGEATANAGVDQKNAPKGFVVLWPSDAKGSAREIRLALRNMYRRRVGVIVVDSRVTPLRLGTVGLALGVSGIHPVTDFRGRRDLHGRRTRITLHAVADDLASAAHLLMGEAKERVPFVIIRDAPVRFTKTDTEKTQLPVRDCLYMSQVSARQQQGLV